LGRSYWGYNLAWIEISILFNLNQSTQAWAVQTWIPVFLRRARGRKTLNLIVALSPVPITLQGKHWHLNTYDKHKLKQTHGLHLLEKVSAWGRPKMRFRGQGTSFQFLKVRRFYREEKMEPLI
jgi:hypothetical protein